MNSLPDFQNTNEAQEYGHKITDSYVLIALQQKREELLASARLQREIKNTQVALNLIVQAQFCREAIEAYREIISKEIVL